MLDQVFSVFTDHAILIKAFIVGFFGSAAYLTALHFRFVGETNESRRIVMEPFLRKEPIGKSNFDYAKCAWYCAMGGFVAVIFQYDVPNFVSIQNLILGATWPAIVSHFLSGRMTDPTRRELEEEMNQMAKSLSEKNVDVSQEQIEKIEKKLKSSDSKK